MLRLERISEQATVRYPSFETDNSLEAESSTAIHVPYLSQNTYLR